MKVEIATNHLSLITTASISAIAIAKIAVQTTQEQAATSKIAILTITAISTTAIILARKLKIETDTKKKYHRQ